MIQAVVFDLDGTLWSSSAEVTASWNIVLQREGVDRPPFTDADIAGVMGLTLPDIAARLLPALPRERQLAVIDACCEEESIYPAAHGASVYPTSEELAALAARYPLFVVSNCQAGYIEAFYKGTGLGAYFKDFESAGNTGLPKWDNIALVVKRQGLKRPVYVGDTDWDYQAARRAGVPFIHAAYGFGQVEGVPAIRRFGELDGLLKTLDG